MRFFACGLINDSMGSNLSEFAYLRLPEKSVIITQRELDRVRGEWMGKQEKMKIL